MTSTSAEATSDYGSDIDAATSEYGSEFDVEEENLIAELLGRIARTTPRERTISGENGNFGNGSEVLTVHIHSEALERTLSVAAVEVFGVSACSIPQDIPEAQGSQDESSTPPTVSPDKKDTNVSSPSYNPVLSPLQRFRTFPKKPLSVTDLVSPAWCELQYYFTLTKFGRKPRTAAMKQGSKVHRALEEQVHVFVPVQTESKEDKFGLRIWNAIQGLRTLRETGLTRELEIWGELDGEVVNGVIDEISFTPPELSQKDQGQQEKGRKRERGQPSITEALSQTSTSTPSAAQTDSNRPVYIADIKTRGTKTVPPPPSLRPTWMQLMLYHKLLSALAQNSVNAETIFARYALRPLEPFTSTFTSNIATLNDDSTPVSSPCFPPTTELSTHPNLSALWSLMISEYALTFRTVAPLLRAEFRYSQTGDLIASELFTYDDAVIEAYVSSEMEWWKGQRRAVGVEVEEAFKCRMCHFADVCEWRKNKIDEATEKHRLRLKERAKSIV